MCNRDVASPQFFKLRATSLVGAESVAEVGADELSVLEDVNAYSRRMRVPLLDPA